MVSRFSSTLHPIQHLANGYHSLNDVIHNARLNGKNRLYIGISLYALVLYDFLCFARLFGSYPESRKSLIQISRDTGNVFSSMFCSSFDPVMLYRMKFDLVAFLVAHSLWRFL